MSADRAELGTARLLRAQLQIDPGPAITLGIVTLILTAVLAVAPAAFALTAQAELRRTLGDLSPVDRYLTSTSVGLPPEWALAESGLAHARAHLPAALQTAVGDGRLVAVAAPVPVTDLITTDGKQQVRLFADPHLAEHVELVDGSWPRTADESGPDPVEVVLSVKTAAAQHWSVGERRTVLLTDGAAAAIVLSGTFRPTDPDSSYWSLNRSVLAPEIFDDGNAPRIIIGAAAVDPAQWRQIQSRLAGVQVRIWFPVDATALAALPPADTLGLLTSVLAAPTRIDGGDVDGPPTGQFGGPAGQPGPITVVRLATRIPVALQGVTQRTSAAAVIVLCMTAPIGSALAVLALSALVLARRRRPALTYLLARGAGRTQLRTLMGLTGAAVCLPATVLGIVMIDAIVPGDLPATGVFAAVAAGCAPVLVLIATAVGRPGAAVRAWTPARRRRRVWSEVGVISIAGVAVYTLVRRSSTAPGSVGVDVLMVAAPLLLSLAACVLVGRLYPLPLAALHRRFARGRGVVGFLGTGRALRDPVVGVLPVLVLVAGVSVAVFCSVMVGTLTTGVQAAAAQSVGAVEPAAGPISVGLRWVLVAGLLITGLSSAIALVLTTVLNAGGRGRLLGVLRVLGVRPAHARWLVVWEIGPIAVVAFMVGALVGIALSLLVGGVVDLRAFVDGVIQPALVVDPMLLAGLLGSLLLVVATAVGIVTAGIGKALSRNEIGET